MFHVSGFWENARENWTICVNRRRVWILHWRQPGLSCFPPNAATRKPLWGVAYAGSPALSFYYYTLLLFFAGGLKKSSVIGGVPYVRCLCRWETYHLRSNHDGPEEQQRSEQVSWIVYMHAHVFRRRSQLLARHVVAAAPPTTTSSPSTSLSCCACLYNMMRSRGSTKCLLLLHHTRLGLRAHAAAAAAF